jgi:hypothetical protein
MSVDPISLDLNNLGVDKINQFGSGVKKESVSNDKNTLPAMPLDSFERTTENVNADSQSTKATSSVAKSNITDDTSTVSTELQAQYNAFLEQYPDISDKYKSELKGYLDSGNVSDFNYFIEHYYPSIISS